MDFDVHASAIDQLCKGVASSSFWLALLSIDQAPVPLLQHLSSGMLAVANAIRMRSAEVSIHGDFAQLRRNTGLLGDRPPAAFFITVCGRFDGQLPDALASLFRPILVQTTDLVHIVEVKLISHGFRKASAVAKKAHFAFQMLREHLPPTSHYSFSKSTLIGVIDDVIQLKEYFSHRDEVDLLVMALSREASRIEPHDEEIFHNTIDALCEDGIQERFTTEFAFEKFSRFYPDLENFESNIALNVGLPQAWRSKVLELFSAASARNGVIALGPSGTGKTSCVEAMARAMTSTLASNVTSGGVEISCVFPKALTMASLYGQSSDSASGALPIWNEGLIPTMLRSIANSGKIDHSKTKITFVVMDGPMDSEWVNNISPLLETSEHMHLPAFEVVASPELNTWMFEGQDLVSASPAAVSRCGIVYFCNPDRAWRYIAPQLPFMRP